MTDDSDAGFDSALDETLEDGLQLDQMPGDDVGHELLRQRIAHGLLRAANSYSAEAHEARVERLMNALPTDQIAARRTSRILPMRPWLVAAAAVLVFGLVAMLVVPSHAQRLLEATVLEHSRSVDRHYELRVTKIDANPEELYGVHDLWLRPTEGGDPMFRLDIRGRTFRDTTLACDGTVVWRRNNLDEADRASVPVAEAEKLIDEFTHSGFHDRGVVDVAGLAGFAVGGVGIREVGRVGVDADGHELVTIECDEIQTNGMGPVQRVFFTIDSVEKVIDVLEYTVETPEEPGVFRLRFEYRGVDENFDSARYQQPW